MSQTTGIDVAEQQEWKGQSTDRKEDGRLLRGEGRFADDWNRPGQLYVHLVRSPYGHARVRSVDVSEAEELSGVVTLTGSEVREQTDPFQQLAPPPGGEMRDYCLAGDRVRFMGEPVVAVAAPTRRLARDAAELVRVDYEPLEAVTTAEGTVADGAPLLHEEVGTNVAWQRTFDWGDIDGALEHADHVVSIDRLHFHRFSSTPLEASAALVEYDEGGGWTLHCNNQMPQFAVMFMAPALRTTTARFRYVTKDIGGGFGIKITSYPYLTILCLLARKARRPIKWTEWRSEHIMGSAHGNERTFLDVRVPVLDDGTILGFDVRALDDVGAYTRYEPLGGVIWSQVTPGCYRFRNIRVDYSTVVTNKTPAGPNRGYSRMQHLWFIERVVDIVAHELGFDPVELRKQNYIQPDEFPYETPNGCVYDSGDYPRMLDLALEMVGHDDWRRRREEARGSGKLIGIGIGTTLDSGANNFGQAQLINPHLPYSGNGEMANARMDLFGEVVLTLGTAPQGQSHETTAAQVAADILGVAPDEVFVRTGQDTGRGVYTGFSGTYASQFAVTGLGAVQGAAEALKADLVAVAAALLEVSEEDVVLADGAAHSKTDPEKSMALGELVGVVHTNNTALPDDLEVTLNRNYLYRPPLSAPDTESAFGNLTLTYAAQLHVCVLEVDEETGQVEILDYVAVDDCGRRINPMVVEGQVHGAAALGIGAVLNESLVYDEDGQLLSTNFLDYKAVTSVDVPDIRMTDIESPSPFSPSGAKGMGEGGGTPLHTVTAALQDVSAQRHGALVTDTHNPAETVHRLLRTEGKPGLQVTSN